MTTRLPAGSAATGGVQFLPGYNVLLSAVRVDRLDLPRHGRRRFLADMDVLGGAVHRVCSERDPGSCRTDDEIHGHQDPVLHAHVWPRYEGEPARYRSGPVGACPKENWTTPAAQLRPHHQGLRDRSPSTSPDGPREAAS